MIKKILCWITCAVLAIVCAGCGDSGQRAKNEQSFRQIGLNQLQAGDYVSAVNAFERALEEHRGGITNLEEDLYFYKAFAEIESGDLQAGIGTYSELLRHKKKNADAYYLRGCAYLGAKNTENALADFENAVRYRDGNGLLYAEIYDKLIEAGEGTAAQAYLEDGLALKGDDGVSCLTRGRLYYASGEYDKARAELGSAKEQGEKMAYLYLGKVAGELGDTLNERTNYEFYVEAYPGDSVILCELGQKELEEGSYDAALAYFEQGLACTDSGNRSQLWAGKIAAMEYTGDFAGAKAEMEDYLEHYPDDEAAQREYVFLKTR